MTRFLKSPLCLGLLLTAASGAAIAQTVFVSDHFTGVNGTTLQAHTPNTGGAWTRIVGNNLSIQGNALRATTTNAGDFYSNSTVAPNADYVVGMSVTFTNANANNYINVVGRANVTLQNGYLAQLQANGAVIVWAVVGGALGAPIINTTTAITINVQHQFMLQMVGNQITVFVDATQFGPVTNSANAGPGVVGLGLNANNTGQVIADDFFAGTFAVTETRMRAMTARRSGSRAVVEWATGREVSNLGFRMWRQDGARRTLLTPSILAGSAFLTSATLTAGNRYRWLDENSTPNSRYWIESIGIDGRRGWDGPVASVAAPIDDTAAHAPLLRDLGQYLTPLAETSAPPAVGRRRAVVPPNALAKQQALAAAAAVKISVAADGWYRVTRDDLLAAGLDPATDPRRLHLYAEVNEVAMTVEGESQNRIDAIRFYGTALDTVSTNTRVYWLAAADGATRRIQTATATGGTPAPASFLVNAERRDKSVFFAALLNGESESFFGPVITDDAMRPATQMLRLNHIDRAAATADIKIALQGGTEAGADPAHDVAITLNGQPLDDIHFNGRDAVTVHRIVPAGFLVEGDNTLTFVAKNGDGDVSVISSAGISYAHTYDFDSATLVMTVAGGSAVAVRGAPANQVYALDVTDPAAPIELAVTVVDGVARFTTPAEAVRTIVATPTFARPLRVEANQPSSLHATAGADMIIVTHRSLLPAIEPLRQLRASQGLSVLVATIDGIYDEYGYGEKSPAALRAFLSASRRWSNAPRYVLLAGDATFDPRNYLGFGDLDLVPTKLIVTREMKTASDSWLTDFDDDGAADIAIGRLPARTLADARIEIGKIIAYENAPAGQPWEKAAVFVSDGDATLGFDRLTASVRDLVPAGYAIQSIDLALSGASAARQSLLASLDQGALLVNFVGHGSVDIWTDSGLFGGEDAKSLHNGERLPFVIAMTCLNGYFHDVYTTSLAEALLAAPGGGAVGVFASSSLTDPHAQAATNQEVVRALLADHATAGEAAMAAQRKATDSDVRRTFLLLGDPSMRLK